MTLAGAGADGLPRRWFLGLRFTPLDLAAAAQLIAERPADAPFRYVVTPNAQWIVGADRGDPRYRQAMEGAWLVLNDSRILRLLSRLLFGRDLPVAAGSDLTAEIIAGRLRPEDRLTVVGGDAEMEQRLRERFGLRHIVRFDPPMGFYRDPAEIDRCAVFVRDHPARYTFLAVGAPQSDLVARRVAELGGATGVGLCVGGSLNFLTGLVQRAPLGFRKANLEWFYRLLQNPRRHARRVFVDSAPVLWVALKARLAPAGDRARSGA